ncbi:MAG TPA: magnesium chelatase domain-containing protein, partial [Chitinophagales bacterium]|nr:magnesium chelatase domain-containing protein [Chitinophagales bacterium]
IAGGIKVEDPAVDLAVVAALLSSYEDTALSIKSCFSGEVGLSGEVRAVNKVEQRVSEADKMGYSKIYISKFNQKTNSTNLSISRIKTIEEFYRNLF